MYPQISRPFYIPFSLYSKDLSPNVSRVDLITNAIIFSYNLIVDCWFFGKFLVKNKISFFARGHFIEGYIANAYIYAIVNSFYFQLNSSLFRQL